MRFASRSPIGSTKTIRWNQKTKQPARSGGLFRFEDKTFPKTVRATKGKDKSRGAKEGSNKNSNQMIFRHPISKRLAWEPRKSITRPQKRDFGTINRRNKTLPGIP